MYRLALKMMFASGAKVVQMGQPATAFLKGVQDRAMPLRFVRIEPLVVPKRSLTADSTERVDTRVLQVIYELDPPPYPVYVGQQVDVFIQRPMVASPPPSTSPAKPEIVESHAKKP